MRKIIAIMVLMILVAFTKSNAQYSYSNKNKYLYEDEILFSYEYINKTENPSKEGKIYRDTVKASKTYTISCNDKKILYYLGKDKILHFVRIDKDTNRLKSFRYILHENKNFKYYTDNIYKLQTGEGKDLLVQFQAHNDSNYRLVVFRMNSSCVKINRIFNSRSFFEYGLRNPTIELKEIEVKGNEAIIPHCIGCYSPKVDNSLKWDTLRYNTSEDKYFITE